MGQKVVPLIRVVRLCTARGDYFIVPCCPYCGRRHMHGATEGMRLAHCIDGDHYVLREGANENVEARL